MAELKAEVGRGDWRADRLGRHRQLQVHREAGHRAGQARRSGRRRTGAEVPLIEPLPVSVIPGVGPVTAGEAAADRCPHGRRSAAVSTPSSPRSSARRTPRAWPSWRTPATTGPVEPERETKSISVEDTFETDLVDRDTLTVDLRPGRPPGRRRLRAAGLFARTVTLKIRRHDFSTHTRSTTLPPRPTRPDAIAAGPRAARRVDLTGGIRLLGVGVAGLTDASRTTCSTRSPDPPPAALVRRGAEAATRRSRRGAPTRLAAGADVKHSEHGAAGSGAPDSAASPCASRPGQTGPARPTFPEDDPALRRHLGPSDREAPGLGRGVTQFERATPRPQCTFARVRATRADAARTDYDAGRTGATAASPGPGTVRSRRRTRGATAPPARTAAPGPRSPRPCRRRRGRSPRSPGGGRRPGGGTVDLDPGRRPVVAPASPAGTGSGSSRTHPGPGSARRARRRRAGAAPGVPPARTAISCMPRQMPSTGRPRRLGGVQQRPLPGVPVGTPGLGPRMRRCPVAGGFTSAPPAMISPSSRATTSTAPCLRRQQHGHPAGGLDRARVRGGQQIGRGVPRARTGPAPGRS